MGKYTLNRTVDDNSVNRLHDVFFYGQDMDPGILKNKGVKLRNPHIASVANYALSIANKATLLRSNGEIAYGIVYSLTHAEIYTLYTGAGLSEYAPEALLASVDGEMIPVLCCNLIVPPGKGESNQYYQQQLSSIMEKLDATKSA